MPDRKIDKIYALLNQNIARGAVIKSDSFPPTAAISRHQSSHVESITVGGFINEQGQHTNSIESVWAGLKIEIKARRGVMLSNLEAVINLYQSIFETKTSNDPKGKIQFFSYLNTTIY